MEVVNFFIGLVVGGITTYITVLLVGKHLMDSEADKLPKIIFTNLGEAYWQSENGLCKAAVLENGIPDFENAVVLNMMEVPAEELPMLLDIISHFK